MRARGYDHTCCVVFYVFVVNKGMRMGRMRRMMGDNENEEDEKDVKD